MGRRGNCSPSPPSWFSFNKSETVKAVILAFCSIQLLFIKGIHAKFEIPNLSQSQDIGHNSCEGISKFLVNPLKTKIVVTPEPQNQ